MMIVHLNDVPGQTVGFSMMLPRGGRRGAGGGVCAKQPSGNVSLLKLGGACM